MSPDHKVSRVNTFNHHHNELPMDEISFCPLNPTKKNLSCKYAVKLHSEYLELLCLWLEPHSGN